MYCASPQVSQFYRGLLAHKRGQALTAPVDPSHLLVAQTEQPEQILGPTEEKAENEISKRPRLR